jgi:CRP-like cAMP-binding protein
MTGIYSNDHYLGIHAILANEAYNDTATALEDSSMCLIPKDLLDPLLNQHPEVAREFIKLLAADIREKEDQLLQLAYNSVRKRMAEAVLRLHHQQSNPSADFKVSREDLAAMAGMATETVSRTLSDFKEEGLISKKGSAITVLDEKRLARMKN